MSIRSRLKTLKQRMNSGPIDPAELRRALRGIEEHGAVPDDIAPDVAELAVEWAAELDAMMATMPGPPEQEGASCAGS